MTYVTRINQLPDSEDERLTDKGYSKETINISFPMLKKVDGTDCEQLRLEERYVTH